MDIFLVRHGEAAASWAESTDPGLSELGQQQAQQTAEELHPLLQPGVQLISSPLLRAQETAVPMVAALGGSPVVIDGAYSEIPSPVPLAQRQAWLRAFMAEQWDSQPENLQQWRTTMMAKLQMLESPTVIFTHFLVMNTVVGKLQGRSETLCFWPDNASFIQLRHTGADLELVALGRQMSSVVN